MLSRYDMHVPTFVKRTCEVANERVTGATRRARKEENDGATRA